MAINENIDQRLYEHIYNTISCTPFYNLLGIELERIGRGYARLGILPRDVHLNALDMVHGGLIVTLADAAMGNAIRSMGIKGVTADINMSFISSPQRNTRLEAEGKVLKAGRNLIFAEAEIYMGNKLIAKSQGTFFKVGEISFD